MEDYNDDAPVILKPAKNRKRPKPKEFKIADKATAEAILKGVQRPEPEFKGKDFIVDRGRLVFKSEQVFMCQDCNAYFANKNALRAHAVKHLDKNLRCQFCGKLFRNDNEEMLEHLQEFHPDLEENPLAEPLRCKKCGKVSRDKRALYRHVRESHRKEPFICQICQFPFTRPENLKDHMRRKHSDQKERDKFPCEICDKKYKCRPSWRKHILDNHRRRRSFKCCICNTIYFQKLTYESHMQRTHLRLAPFYCKACDFSAILRSSWVKHCGTKRHNEAVATAPKSEDLEDDIEPKYQIPEYDDNDNLDEKTTTTTSVTFQELKRMPQAELLKFCWKRVPKILLYRIDTVKVKRSPALLKLRDEAENEDLPKDQLYLKCVYCDEQFSQLEQVECHEPLCYEERTTGTDHPCEICGKKFSMASILRRHLRTHTKEKPYKCSFCPNLYTSATTRLKHEKMIHFGAEVKAKCQDIESGPRVKSIQCPFEDCDKKFVSMKNMKTHYSQIHTTEPEDKRSCTKCGVVFKHRKSLMSHIKREHSEKTLVMLECKPCKRIYRTRNSYLYHLKRPRHGRKVKEFIATSRRKIKLVKEDKEDEEDQSMTDSVIPFPIAIVKIENPE